MGTLRAAAITGLGVVALAGAAVAGVEQGWPDPPPPPPPPPVAAPPPAAVPAPAPDVATTTDTGSPRAPCRPIAVICVQLSSESAWVQDGPGPVPVRVGRADSPTPLGLFAVAAKRPDHVSGLDGTPMPFAVFFTSDVALYEGDVTEPSAGSVRLPPGAGETFFDAVTEGDAVQVVP